MVLAAFCAAETQDEKNPLPWVTLRDSDLAEGVLASSIVGVRGAEMAFDSLLGWCTDPDSECPRRCDIMLPEGLTFIPLASLDSVGDSEFRTGDLGVGARESTGVGGVTVVRGAVDAALGGVCGLVLVFNGEMPALEMFGGFELSVFAPTRIGGGAGAFVRAVSPVSLVVVSAV